MAHLDLFVSLFRQHRRDLQLRFGGMSAALVKLADDLARCAETEKTGYLEASIWTKVEITARQLANGLRSHGQTGSWTCQKLSPWHLKIPLVCGRGPSWNSGRDLTSSNIDCLIDQ